jgi:hypothetical protein
MPHMCSIRTYYISDRTICSAVCTSTGAIIVLESLMTISLVSLTGGGNNRHDASHGNTLSHNVVSSKTRLSGIQIYNFSGDRH